MASAVDSDSMHSWLEVTTVRTRAGSDPLLSEEVWVTLEETGGTEPLLPETAVPATGCRIWRNLVRENIGEFYKLYVLYF